MYPTIEINIICFYPSFLPYFSIPFVLLQLDLVAATLTPWVAVVLAYPSSRCHLAGGEASLSRASGSPDRHRFQQTGPSGLPDRDIQFFLF
jgi:hypothetical protein